ncbi:tautomerase family protein [Mycobacterium sp.]|uniref:tautomerase family protein n=1 Tax=Mycobacterium sp. TaxID=1785 RepID=UPI0025F1A32D|nr:tautomerase family protein [Mycobacterium sp.]MBW0012762.1 tautomerase family protein [Mycobacterium sp.]
MPLVRIDLPRTIEPERRSLIGDIVYQAMADVLNVPDGDKFQIITAHDAESLRMDPAYLGIDRSGDAFIVDITLNAGRSVELKQRFYATVVERLSAQAKVRPQDVLIVLTEVAKENWSFGNGVAQYV